jgi:hypothetical protein
MLNEQYGKVLLDYTEYDELLNIKSEHELQAKELWALRAQGEINSMNMLNPSSNH